MRKTSKWEEDFEQMIKVQCFCNFTGSVEMCEISVKIESVNTSMGILVLLALFFHQDQSGCVFENINNIAPYSIYCC